MTRIFANENQLTATGPNASFGNHIFHLLYVLSVSRARRIPLVVPCDSNLDPLFDLAPLKTTSGKPPVFWAEEQGYVGRKGLLMQKRNLAGALSLLSETTPLPAADFTVEGWFQHQSTAPAKADFEAFLPIRSEVHGAYLARYSDLTQPDAVAVHYRGTDFNGFGDTDRRLPARYYQKALARLETEFLAKGIETVSFHLFSDEPQVLARYVMRGLLSTKLKVRSLAVHSDRYFEDWLGLYLATNIVGSNSSFCTSASLYKSGISIQPRGMLNLNSRHPDPVDSYQTNARIVGF